MNNTAEYAGTVVLGVMGGFCMFSTFLLFIFTFVSHVKLNSAFQKVYGGMKEWLNRYLRLG